MSSTSIATTVSAPPVLLMKLDQEHVAMSVSALAVDVAIAGRVARTRLRITFRNPHPRDLEGELTFPLPEGAALSGYALDLNGELVAAALVEKQKARVVFEAEVRKNVDPGLIEKVAGNQFRTRIWPLPAEGTRTIEVTYVSALAAGEEGAVYELPLRFDPPKRDVSAGQNAAAPFSAWEQLFGSPAAPAAEAADAFSLRVQVARGSGTPSFPEAGALGFVEGPAGWSAELRDAAQAPKYVRVAVPWSQDVVAVEAQADGEHHFRVDARLPSSLAGDAQGADHVLEPERVALVWDASASRAVVDKQPEFDLLRALLERWGSLELDLFVLRDRLAEPRRFSIVLGEAEALLEALSTLAYDGGTRLGALALADDYDLCLVVGDGVSTLGDELPEPVDAPLYVVSTGASVNAPLLRHLAESGGGAWFDLSRTHPDEAAAQIGVEGLCLLGVDGGAGVADVFPRGRASVEGGAVGVSGRLLADEAELTLRFGRGRTELARQTYRLSRSEASSTGLVGRLWAQAKVDALALEGERTKAEVLELGRRFHLVTPNTSLLVLETLEQHLEHSIPPAPSRTSMRAAYDAHHRTQAEREQERVATKLDEVHGWWTSLVSWWETEFDPAPPPAPEEKEKSALGAEHEFFSGAPAPEPEGEVCYSLASEEFDEAPEAAMAAPPPPAAAPRSRARRDSAPQRKKKAKDDAPAGREAGIRVKPWNPDTPYLSALADAEDAYAAYLAQRSEHGRSPSFYLDCASFFFRAGQRELALRVLSNVAELELENPQLLRIVGYKLETEGELELAAELLSEVRALRPEEPQSFRDLALVRDQQGRFKEAAELLWAVVKGAWDDRFPEIESIALMELNRVLARAERAEAGASAAIVQALGVQERFVKAMDLDLRIALAWDADLTDVDLWVFEPNEEKCYYSHNLTRMGGRMSRDFTQGYGPEVYTLRRGLSGTYRIEANYFGSGQQTLVGPATLMATVFTNFGRENEERQTLTLRVTEVKDTTVIGEVRLG